MKPRKTRAWKPLAEMTRHQGFATFVVGASIFTEGFLYDVVIPPLPGILRDRVGIPENEVQNWSSVMLSVYGAAFLIVPPLAGILIDALKASKVAFQAALLGMAAATALFFGGQNIWLLVVGRLCQGISGAIVGVAGMALLTLYMDEDQIGDSGGIFTMATSTGEMIGPVVGGLVYTRAGHLGLLGVVVGWILVNALMRLLLRDPPHSIDASAESSDADSRSRERDSLLKDDRRSDYSPDDTVHESQQSKGFARFGTFLYLVLEKEFIGGLLLFLLVSTIRTSLESTLTIFVDKHYGWSSTAAGLTLACLLIPNVAGLWLARIMDKYGARWFCIAACLGLAAIFPGLAFTQHNDETTKILFCCALTLLGLCLAVLMTAQFSMISVLAINYQKRCELHGMKVIVAGRAFGLLNSVYASGMFLGPLWTTLVLENIDWYWYCYSFSIASAVSALISLALFRKKVPQDDRLQ